MPAASPASLNKLLMARKKAGLGQKSVAWLLSNRSASAISGYEHGRTLPTLRTALKLEIIYGTPVSELYAPLRQEVAGEIARLRAACPGASRSVILLPATHDLDFPQSRPRD
jgi:transcriptional regulator with XRE-family HTH domain